MITPGNIAVTSGTAVSVSPTTTTIYTLTVTPPLGTAITQTTTVSIQSPVTVNPSNTGAAISNQLIGMNMAVWDDFTNGGSIQRAVADFDRVSECGRRGAALAGRFDVGRLPLEWHQHE